MNIKFIFIISFLLIFSCPIFGQEEYSKWKISSRASEETPLLDSVLTDLGDGQLWLENQEKIEYEYDSDGNPVIITHYKKSTDTGKWEFDYREKDTYNDFDMLIVAVKEIWDSAAETWGYQLKIEKTYDSNGNRTSNASFHWNTDDNRWVGDNKLEEGFDNNKNMILNAQYTWNDDQEDWEGQVKTEANFDLDSKLNSYSYYRWEADILDWFEYFHFEFEYTGQVGDGLGYTWNENTNEWVLNRMAQRILNSSFQVISEEEYYYFSPGATWRPLDKFEYEYDDQGNVVLSIGYGVDISDDWIVSSKLEQTYNGEDIDLSASYIWDNSLNIWVGSFKYERTRDSEGKQILFVTYGWNNTTNAWAEATKSESKYNEDNPTYEFVSYKWENEQWENVRKQKYYYYQIILALEEVQRVEFTLFPNPAVSQIKFELKTVTENGRWSILSLNGSILKTGNFNNSISTGNELIDISSISPGVYFMSIVTDAKIIRKRFVKVICNF